MEKVFEAFRDILGILSAVSGCEVDMDSERIKTVQQALTELKAIKESKPSEAMECLEKIKGFMTYYELYNTYKKEIDTIKTTLLKAQELEKVLEVLKPLCEVVETPVKKLRYLKMNGVVVYTFKNKEEFDLLKRWSEK